MVVYCIVGVLLAVLYFVVASVGTSVIGLQPATASGMAYLLNIPVAYFAHRMVTFRSSELHHVAFPRFVVTSCMGLALSWLIPHLLLRMFAIPHWLAFLAVGVAVPTINFLATRIWVFGVSRAARHNAAQSLQAVPEETSAFAARRRRLLHEGAVLLRYVLGQPPPFRAMRQYVRSVMKYDDGRPVHIPRLVAACPSLLRAIEPTGKRSALQRRLRVATIIAEAAGDKARRFQVRGGARSVTVMRLLGVVGTEAVCLPLRILLGRRN
jgi:putative flippase GtrA